MIAGYCWPQSVAPGETVALHASTTAATFGVEIVRQGAVDERVFDHPGLAGVEHDVPADAASGGCGWPAALSIEVGDWRSGFYLVRLTTEDSALCRRVTVVR